MQLIFLTIVLEDKLQVPPTINTAALSLCLTLKTNTLPSGSQEKQQESAFVGSKLKQSCWHPQNTVCLKMWANRLLPPSYPPWLGEKWSISFKQLLDERSVLPAGRGACVWTTNACAGCQHHNTETLQEAPCWPCCGDIIIKGPQAHRGAGSHTLRNWAELMGGGNRQSQPSKNVP